MNRLIKSFGIICLFAALFVVPGIAFEIHVEGQANLRGVLATDELVLLAKSVSGDQPDEIIALNAKTGGFLWRDTASKVYSEGLVTPNGDLYLVANDELQKRHAASGKIEWGRRLNKIAQQGVTNSFAITDLKDWALDLVGRGPGKFTKPDWFNYKIVSSGDKILVFREAMRGGGCIVSRCYEDWLILEEGSGRQVMGGAGQVVGQAGRTWLIGNQNDFSIFRDGVHRALTNASLTTRFYLQADVDSDEWSFADRCLFEFRTATGEVPAIFDSRNDQIVCFPVPNTHTNVQSGWVLMETNFVRYSRSTPDVDEDSEAKDTKLWFELYDFGGRLLASAEKETGSTNQVWMSYVKRNGHSIHFETQDEIYQLDLHNLDLRLLSTSTASQEERRYSSFSCGRTIYRVDGCTNILQMAGNQFAHDLVVIAIDSDTQKQRWRHIEPATIHKAVEE